MENFTYISSTKNDHIKKIVKLKNKNKREKNKLFIIEGYKEILSAVDANIEIEFFFICPELFSKDNEKHLIQKCKEKGILIFKCSREVFEKISYRDKPDGYILIAKHFDLKLEGLQNIINTKKKPFLVICEAIEKPGNLGTILRTADASGVDAVIVADPMTDVFNPNVVRASIGTLFTVPVFKGKSQDIIDLLKKNNIEIVCTTPFSNINYTKIDLKKAIAIVFGTEKFGLSKIWLKNSNKNIKIPMLGKVDSLNVAAAATILLYETVRQRHL